MQKINKFNKLGLAFLPPYGNVRIEYGLKRFFLWMILIKITTNEGVVSMKRCLASFTPFLLLFFFVVGLNSAPVPLETAQKAAQGWLSDSNSSMWFGEKMSNIIESVKPVKSPTGELLFYAVSLAPEGWLILSSDDLLEPVMAFSGTGKYSEDPNTAQNSLLFGNTTGAHANLAELAKDSSAVAGKNKWDSLVSSSSQGTNIQGRIANAQNVGQVWVAPFVTSRWGQTDAFGTNYVNPVSCFNYYTPSDATNWFPGLTTNYPTGGLVVAETQILRYYQFPSANFPLDEYQVHVNGAIQTKRLMAGTGTDGAYNWSNMPAAPINTTGMQQRKDIGGLCYNAAISIDPPFVPSQYGPFGIEPWNPMDPEGSTAFNPLSKYDRVRLSFKNTFHYSNAIIYEMPNVQSSEGLQAYNKKSISADLLHKMVLPNLDAGRPVLLGLHYWNTLIDVHYPLTYYSVVCDGYGFNAMPYIDPWYHMNLCNLGIGDGWYNGGVSFTDANSHTWYFVNVINSCVYNIFQEGTGEIISGRVATAGGIPISGKTVMLKYTVSGQQPQTRTCISDQYGIYSFGRKDKGPTDLVPSNQDVVVSCQGSMTVPYNLTTGKSYDTLTGVGIPGNLWGINFLIAANPIIATSVGSLAPQCARGANASPNTFQIWNSGLGTLNFSITDDVTWLSCAPTSGTSTGPTNKTTITVSYNTSALAAGTYNATITITDATATNSPKTINVTLTVLPPMISTSLQAMSVGTPVATVPANRTFDIWNSGAGTLYFVISSITYNPAVAPWLSCGNLPVQGTSTGQSDKQTITLSFLPAAATLPQGVYDATITVVGTNSAWIPDPTISTRTVTVTLYVGPYIAATPTSFNLSVVKGFDAPQQSFSIWNAGGGALNYTITDNSGGWLVCTPNIGSSVGPNDVTNVIITFHTAGMLEGTYNAIITITAPGATNTPLIIGVSLNVYIAPAIKLNTNIISQSCIAGETATPSGFTISNSNADSTLNYFINENVAWLSCDPTSGVSNGIADQKTIAVTYASSDLPVGIYNTTITITSPTAANSPQIVTVSLEVKSTAIATPANLTVSLLSNTGGINRDDTNKVIFWKDFSPDKFNSAWQTKNPKKPLISNVLAGNPTIAFTGKSLLEIASSAGVNSGGPYTEKTIGMYIRTGMDVTKRQTIFAIGNNKRGMNAYIYTGRLYINAWNLTDDDGTGPATAWGPIYTSTPVTAETAYTLFYTFDQPTGTMRGYLNGIEFENGPAIGVQKLYATTANSAIGNLCKTTYFHDGKAKTVGFSGKVAAFIHYNGVLSVLERTNIETYMGVTFGNSFLPVDDFVLWLDNSIIQGIQKNATNGLAGWFDKSTSLAKFYQNNNTSAPLCQENVLNSQRGILFDGIDDYVMSKNNTEINSSKTPYTQKMMFIVFQTGADVTRRQVIWSQGDKNTGLSAYVSGGNVYLCAWDMRGSKTSAAWGPVNVSGPIAASTPYCLQMTFDQPNNKLEGFLNGATIGTTAGIGTLAKHKAAVIGALKGTGQFHDITGSTGSYYSGYIFEILMYNEILDAGNIGKVETYLNGKYGIVFQP